MLEMRDHDLLLVRRLQKARGVQALRGGKLMEVKHMFKYTGTYAPQSASDVRDACFICGQWFYYPERYRYSRDKVFCPKCGRHLR